ncbi:iron-sulfur cluster carrier protein ApbC [Legionella sp. km772]|uniref:iron-sulfur cluster carrier protein ApbC n=1 Tax=Legionella sp. km772 TaxID=2498111 RepID=UPI000F8DDE49|nr:iron-sulfur cluster carrier protein ApbC [Legionella sp. km772]RUR13893.1 iron-sulfur cluster carrier protein ApbC [Legionella sp. km772]
MSAEAIIISLVDSLVDPFLELTGKDMGLKYTLEMDNNRLQLSITAGFPSLLLEESYKNIVESALKKQFPTHQCSVVIKQFIRAHKTQFVGKGLRGVKNTIAVASGKGGVGKSTVTVNLAAALAKLGARVGILDADIYGPSIPLMLGTQGPVEIADDFYLPIEAYGIQTMSIAYLTNMEHALIWRGPMLAKSLIQMLDGTGWNELDYLFIDLPPGTGDIQLTLVQKIPLTAAIVVTTPQNVATLDAQKALTMFEKTGIDVLGVIENMSTHLCSNCGHEETIFGEGGAQGLCQNHHSVLLGQLPLNSNIRKQCDKGTPIASQMDQEIAKPFIKTALKSAIELAQKPINYADKFPRVVVE